MKRKTGLLIFIFFGIVPVFSAIRTVTSSLDNNTAGTLRYEIANANPGDVIQFNIAPGNLQSIQLTGGNIAINKSLSIDGSSQPGFDCNALNPVIEIFGTGGGAAFEITANNITLTSLCINRFAIGLMITGDNITVQGCYIGVDPTGTIARPNNASGMIIFPNSDNIQIGGAGTCNGNVISSNMNHGVEVLNTCTNVSFVHNFIGTDITGSVDLGNSNHGIFILNSSTIVIGTEVSGNVVSGNNQQGIHLENCSNVSILGNMVGANLAGTVDLGNNSHGIFAQSTSNLTIGNTASRNLISGNDQGMVLLLCSNVSVQGNYVGLGSNGNTAIGNSSSGITLDQVTTATIGGSVTGSGNAIGSNGGIGINVSTCSGITIRRNYIGVSADGMSARGNGAHGIQVQNSPNTIIGGDRSTQGNIISNSVAHGINYDPNGNGGTIQGNLIGTDINGSAAFGNGLVNIVAKSDNMIIGGNTSNLGNVIVDAKHALVGCGILLADASNASVRFNLIGIALDGITALGNKTSGINMSVEGGGKFSANHVIEYNTIAFNGGDGVLVGSALNSYLSCNNENQNKIVRNTIFCNGLKAINLTKGTCNAGNLDRATPTLNTASANGYFLEGNSNPNDSIHIYAEGNCASCEGKFFIAGVKADGTGYWSYSSASYFGGKISATATDVSNNTSEYALCASIPLPVQGLQFSLRREGEEVNLFWSTWSEENNDYFVVERSVDGIHFFPIATQDGKNNSAELSQYSYVDVCATEAYYRIRQVDHNGQYAFSKTLKAEIMGLLSAFPNPFSDQLEIQLPSQNGTLTLLDALGRIVFSYPVENQSRIILNTSELSSQAYYLGFITQSESLQSKIIKMP